MNYYRPIERLSCILSVSVYKYCPLTSFALEQLLCLCKALTHAHMNYYKPFVPMHSIERRQGVESVAKDIQRQNLHVLNDAILNKANSKLLSILCDQLWFLGERATVRVGGEG